MRRFPQPAGTSGPGAYGILVDGDVLWYGCGQQLCRMDAHGTRVFGQESGLPGRELQMHPERRRWKSLGAGAECGRF